MKGLGKHPAKNGGSEAEPVVTAILIRRIYSLFLLPDKSIRDCGIEENTIVAGRFYTAPSATSLRSNHLKL
jgi:hypothetical protein